MRKVLDLFHGEPAGRVEPDPGSEPAINTLETFGSASEPDVFPRPSEPRVYVTDHPPPPTGSRHQSVTFMV